VADGDRAVVRWSAQAHHEGELLGIAPSGREIRFRGMTWMVFRDGKIVEGWDSWNLGGLLNDCRSASGG
jgi:predicted ester cyclase